MRQFRRADLASHRKKATVKTGAFTLELEGFTDICDIARLVAALEATSEKPNDISVTYAESAAADETVFYLHQGLRI